MGLFHPQIKIHIKKKTKKQIPQVDAPRAKEENPLARIKDKHIPVVSVKETGSLDSMNQGLKKNPNFI